VRIVSRKEWGARQPMPATKAQVPATELWLHHDAIGSAPAGAADEALRMRRLEGIASSRFGSGHTVSYTFAVMPSGAVLEGHGVDRRGTHTKGHNTAGRGIVWAGNYETMQPTAAQIEATGVLIAFGYKQRWWNVTKLTGPHRAVRATACPGDNAVEAIPAVNRAAERARSLNARTPAPSMAQRARVAARRRRPLDLPRVILRYRPGQPLTKSEAVRMVQLAVGMSNRQADGIYGPTTAQWVKVAQHRLGVVADGVYGPATEAALERWHNRGRKA
jgi:hypothetical protein